VLRSPYDTTLFANAMEHVGESVWSETAAKDTIIEVGIRWSYLGETGKEWGVLTEEVGPGEYLLYFEDVGQDADYNDVIVRIEIYPMHFTIEAERNAWAMESVPIRVIARDISETEATLDGAINITLNAVDGGSFIVGSDTLDDAAEVPYEMARSGQVRYLDYYGLPWSGPDPLPVALEAWRTDAPDCWGRGYLTVYPLCQAVQVSADNIGPGDTAKIAIMMKKLDGTLIPFQEGEYLFRVEASGDQTYGALHSLVTNDKGTVLCGMQPFEFIAGDSINTDSAIVEIRAQMIYDCDGGGGSALISTANNEAVTGIQALPPKVQMRKAVTDGKVAAIVKQSTLKKRDRAFLKNPLSTRISTTESTKKKQATTGNVANKELFSSQSMMKMSLGQEGETCDPLVDTVVIVKVLNHFEVVVVPDTIEHSKSSIIKVIPKNKKGEIIEIVDKTELNFLLSASGQKYGRLIAPEGDGPTVNITYGSTKEGKLTYVADGKYVIGDSAKEVEVSVVQGDDENINGIGRFYIRPTIEPFCQGDSRWAGTKYDEYVKKDKNGNIIKDKNGNPVYYGVGDKGCALTCMAMIAHAGGAETDPGKLADHMRENNGFDGARVVWSAIDDLTDNTRYSFDACQGSGLQYKADKKTVDLSNSTNVALSDLDRFLDNGSLIIAQVYNPSTGNQHWVLVTNKEGNEYNILDPGCYSGRTTLSNGYGNNVYKFAVYSKN
jgi:hypothetical protein